ncbi:MAG: ABC transporter permease [Saprospiraceae bacterium]
MNQLKYLLAKEFRQIFRNRALLPMIFIMPVVQLLIMPLAADYEIKNINLTVVDHDHSTTSQQLLGDVTASGYFRLVSYGENYQQAMQHIETDKADLILEIPSHFERGLMRRELPQPLLLSVNAINGTKANLGATLPQRHHPLFQRGLLLQLQTTSAAARPASIDLRTFQLVQFVSELQAVHGAGHTQHTDYHDWHLPVQPQHRQGKRSGYH